MQVGKEVIEFSRLVSMLAIEGAGRIGWGFILFCSLQQLPGGSLDYIRTLPIRGRFSPLDHACLHVSRKPDNKFVCGENGGVGRRTRG